MTPAARVAAASMVLDQIASGLPAEVALTRWARGARFAGSKDRAAIRDHVFDALRCRRSYACLGGGSDGRGLMLGLVRAQGLDATQIFAGEGYGLAPLDAAEQAAGHVPQGADALDLPDWLMPIWQASLGENAACVAETQRHRAPVMVRVNSAKSDRAGAIAALDAEGISALPADIADTAIILGAGARKLAQSQTYLQGLVELQDGAAQALVGLLDVPQAGRILDYCAGGGGKVLAMAPRAGKARLFAHDAHAQRLKDLPARAARADVAVEIVIDHSPLAGLAPFDLVLADVPCSGSGTWRRSPEAKWLLSPDSLQALNATQDLILRQAAPLVAKGGVLAYATCSVLQQENDDRISQFLGENAGWRQVSCQHWLPGPEGDGFFLAVLRRDL